MTARTTTRLISETQKALDVKEGVHLPERDRFLVAPRPDIFPLEPPDADWGRHDRLDGWDPDRLGSPRGDAQRVDVERPSVPIEDMPSDGMTLSDTKHAQPSVALTSFDAAACYVPFHFSTRHWGIHVWKSGLLSLVSDLIGHTRLTVGQTWIVGFAWQALFLHELFHHWVEVGVARAQAPHVLGDWKFFDSIFCALYPPYFHDRPSSALEEALANALVANQIDRFYHPSFRSTAEYRHLRIRILRVMDAQPWPYCDYVKVLSRTHHAEGRAHLMDRAFIQLQLNKTGFPRRPSSSEIMPPDIWFTGQRVHGSATCPVYFIDDMPAFPLVFSKPFPKWNGLEVLVHSNDHKPPHIHAIHLGTREERRFTWDDLRPLDAEPRRPVQRDVNRYCDHFRRKIDKRVKSMPWA